MNGFRRWSGLTLVFLLLAGCQKTPVSTTTAQTESDSTEAATDASENGNILPVASINASPPKPLKKLDGLELEEDTEMVEDDVEIIDEPQPGTPEFTLREVTKLKIQAPPANVATDPDAARAFRKERNDKIIELATKVIAKTHKDKAKVRTFEVAMDYMLEARLELALQGDKTAIEALYDDAATLWELSPKSKPAANAAFMLVNLAYNNAKRSKTDTKWLTEFHRQAIHFAKNFPQEEHRAMAMLFTAARSCEAYGMNKQAVEGYNQLLQSFPHSNQALLAKGVLRRLQLVGKPVQLGGPCIDSGHLTMDDLSGKTVLLVFWSTQAAPFLKDLPALLEFQKAYAKQGLTLVGVCLDEDQAAVEKFITEHNMDWPQIFYSEAGKTGWNNPIASYYGIQEVSNWLINSKGVVVSTSAKVSGLEEQLSPLLKRGISRLPSNPPR